MAPVYWHVRHGPEIMMQENPDTPLAPLYSTLFVELEPYKEANKQADTLASPAMARAPSTSNCLLFLVTPQPHKLLDVVVYPKRI